MERRKFAELLIGTGAIIASLGLAKFAESNRNNETRDEFLNPKDFGEKYILTSALPIIQADGTTPTSLLNPTERQIVEGLGIDSISALELKDDKGNSEIVFSFSLKPGAKIGKSYTVFTSGHSQNNLKQPEPMYALSWERDKPKLEGNVSVIDRFMVSRPEDGRTYYNLYFPFPPTTLDRSFVFVLNSGLIEVNGKDTPAIPIPLQFKTSNGQNLPSPVPQKNLT